MQSRIQQLVLRYLSIGAAFAAAYFGIGVDTSAIMEMTAPIIAALIAVVANAMDLLIHKAETGSVVAPAGQAKE